MTRPGSNTFHVTSLLRAAAFTSLVTVLGAVPAFAQSELCPPVQDVTNGVSAAPIVVDGQFSGFTGSPDGTTFEWMDVTPRAFATNAAGQLVLLCPNDPAADTIVYTAIAPGEGSRNPMDLYLMYDFLAMNKPGFTDGQVVAHVDFPITFTPKAAPPQPRQVNIQVQFIARQGGDGGVGFASSLAAEPPSCSSSFFDVFFDVAVVGDFNGDGVFVSPPSELDINGRLAFNTSSPNKPDCHGIAELEVGLRIPPNFGTPGGPFPGSGINPETGLYDPAPKFWGSGAKFDPADPDPLTSLILTTINPDGSVSAASTSGGKKIVLDKLIGLRSSTTDKHSRDELADAIQFLRRSLNPALYQDPDRPNRKHGEEVFELEEGAVHELGELLGNRKTPASVRAALPGCIDLLLKVDRMFALTAIDDAIAAQVNKRRIKEAEQDVAEGDAAAAAGRLHKALERYEEAWLDVTHREHEHKHDHEK